MEKSFKVKELPGQAEPEDILPVLSQTAPADPVVPRERRVLLGEDNPVNSRVAVRLLEKLGFQVDIVSSGWEAVEAAAANLYEVILLDCDTPTIGGYHTVITIRQNELPSGRRTPIVALTSYTMQWDRREREAAGIDGYIAKPIQIEAMTLVLARFVDAPKSLSTQLLALDRHVLATLRQLTEGDVDQLRELIDLFLMSSAMQIERLRGAAANRDLGVLSMASHSLRGASGQVGARRMDEICGSIETLARAGSDAGVVDLVAELELAFDRVKYDLANIDLDQLAQWEPQSILQEEASGTAHAEVLVAEDDPLIARFLMSSLSGAGFRVTHVKDGEAALAAIDEKHYRCVILDVNMPKLDGYGVLSEMRLRPSGKRTPVLMLSLRSQEHDIVHAFDLGVDDYVTKPFSPAEVISRVRRLMTKAQV